MSCIVNNSFKDFSVSPNVPLNQHPFKDGACSVLRTLLVCFGQVMRSLPLVERQLRCFSKEVMAVLDCALGATLFTGADTSAIERFLLLHPNPNKVGLFQYPIVNHHQILTRKAFSKCMEPVLI